MRKPIAVVVASGGLDSCVCCALAALDHELAMLHVGYGQRTQVRERRAFDEIADYYDVSRRLVLSMEHFRSIGGSSLTDITIPVPLKPDGQDIPNTYVPFRNANILAAGTSFAEVIGARSVYIGVNSVDSSGYPDCRPEFIDAFNRLIEVGTKVGRIRIQAPLLHMTKREIVTEGIRLGAPIEKSWSCYVESDVACGRCDSCRLRLGGFRDAGYIDPIPYTYESQDEDTP